MAATMAPGKPALENNHEWVDAAARLKELEHQHAETLREIPRLEEILGAAQAQDTSIRTRAAALTTGGTAIDLIDVLAVRTQQAETSARERLLREAIRQQASKVADLTRKVSRSICDALRPEYRSVVRASVLGAAEFVKAREAEQAFRDHLQADGIATGTLEVLASNPFGAMRDSSSRISTYLRDACKHDVISSDEYRKFTGRSYPA